MIEHQKFLNKAINYIIENKTVAPNLDKVAGIAGFSKFHFHRLFKDYTGEPLAVFTKRIRLEHAAFLLVFYKHRSIRDIALSCGYNSSQSFSTAFKKQYQVTPKVYQKNLGCQGISVEDPLLVAQYAVSIKYVESFSMVYERSFGDYTNEAITQKRKKVLQGQPNKVFVGISWDNPNITPEKNCRYDFGYISDINKDTSKEITQTVEAKMYAYLSCPLKEVDTIQVWDYLYVNWLVRHGYKPDATFCFEQVHPNKDTIEFYLPIKKI